MVTLTTHRGRMASKSKVGKARSCQIPWENSWNLYLVLLDTAEQLLCQSKQLTDKVIRIKSLLQESKSVWIYQLGSSVRELDMKSWVKNYPFSTHQKYSRRPVSAEEQETSGKQWLYKDNWFSFFNNVWLARTDIFISKQTQVFLDDVSPLSNWSRLLLQPTDFKGSSLCVIKKWQSSNTPTPWEAKSSHLTGGQDCVLQCSGFTCILLVTSKNCFYQYKEILKYSMSW